MCGYPSYLLALLLLGSVLPSLVQSCSCAEDAFLRSRTDVIRDDFTESYSPNIYTAMVIAATCNCVPGSEPSAPSSSLSCQRYQLMSSENVINTTLLSRGECQFERYGSEDYPPTQLCSVLDDRLATEDLTVEGPVPPSEGAELPVSNLTSGANRCDYVCPFKEDLSSAEQFQPCLYTVRVVEVFKGTTYEENEVIEVTGPDVLTTCGDPGLLLQISTQYVAGVGGGCSPIGGWSELSSYSDGELELLRELRAGGAVATVSSTAGLLLSLSLLALWL